MAGHSKWANIKHRKARQDAVKGKLWSKCSKAIIVAAKAGGGDPSTNLALRYAIDEAKAANMPKDTIEKAVAKGAGTGDNEVEYTEIRYEGYGPGGVAIIADCLTDNVNRTAPELRKLFEKGNGNLAKPGAVAFGFSQKGVILVDAGKVSEDQLMELVLEAGAEDVSEDDGLFEITCEPAAFLSVRDALAGSGIEPESAEITMIPATMVPCDAGMAEKVMRLVDAIDEHDDVQNVYHNADIAEDVLANLS
ncbi:MAG: YebC/PmpR family DNA-binding transcriptional regulator [Phycisphaerales bacterium]